MLHAVIMAGGAGTRFWPASRGDQPKQLLCFSGDRSLLQATVGRLKGLVEPERCWVITNKRLVDRVSEQLGPGSRVHVLGEPAKRDTAACIGLAALLVMNEDPGATMVVMPSDHVIEPPEAFQRAVRQAVELVAQDPRRIVTFGIRPTYPAEAFGYIERGDRLDVRAGDAAVFHVVQFREKPKFATAQRYVQAGSFFWNSGIFVWRAATILEYLEQFASAIRRPLDEIAQAIGSAEFAEVLERRFPEIPARSIDHAVMEHVPGVVVIEAPFAWDDVGSWQALARLHGADADGNTLVGKVVAVDTHGTIVRSDGDHLVATLGIEDCIVIHTPDATLVARRSDEEMVRRIVAELEKRGWAEYL